MSKNNRISRILSLTLILMMAFSFLPTGLQPSEVQADTEPYPIEISQTRADEMAKNFFFSNTTATYTKKPHSDYGIKSWSVKVKERPDTRYSLIYYGIAKVDSPQYGGRGWWDLRPGRRYYLYEQKAMYSGYHVLIDTRTGELHPTGDMWPPISDILSPIEDSTVSGITSKEYTGSAIKQNIVVKHKGSTLRQNVDYTLKYKNNVKIGTATVEVYGIGKYAGKITRTFKITEKQVPLPKNAVRVYGNSRYATANKITDQVKKLNGGKRFSSIIVATGVNYPDALAGSYLAKRKNAPILITSPAEENNVVNYIKKNLTSGGTVYILGGTGVVPNSFVSKLNSSGLRYKRLGGSNRYDTNLKILNESGTSGNELIVVTGRNFPDALSASAAGRPILLVDNTLTPSQKTFLNKNKLSKITIIGGTGAVSNKVKNELSKYGSTSRVSGSSRYETSAKVAQKYFGSAKTVVLAIGTNYPDALTGGPLALKLNAPMVLTSSLAKDYTYARSYRRSAGVSRAYVLGGPTLVSNNAVANILK